MPAWANLDRSNATSNAIEGAGGIRRHKKRAGSELPTLYGLAAAATVGPIEHDHHHRLDGPFQSLYQLVHG